MSIKVHFKSELTFVDQEAGFQSFVEGTNLEKVLTEMFRQVVVSTVKTADVEDEVPMFMNLRVQLELFDADGHKVEDGTPRGLFTLLLQSERDALRKGKKKGVNNGRS
jgi:hypothetical protein